MKPFSGPRVTFIGKEWGWRWMRPFSPKESSFFFFSLRHMFLAIATPWVTLVEILFSQGKLLQSPPAKMFPLPSTRRNWSTLFKRGANEEKGVIFCSRRKEGKKRNQERKKPRKKERKKKKKEEKERTTLTCFRSSSKALSTKSVLGWGPVVRKTLSKGTMDPLLVTIWLSPISTAFSPRIREIPSLSHSSLTACWPSFGERERRILLDSIIVTLFSGNALLISVLISTPTRPWCLVLVLVLV